MKILNVIFDFWSVFSPQLIKVYGEDNHSRSLWVSPGSTAREVCHMLVQTAHCSDQENWALLELHPTLGLGKTTQHASLNAAWRCENQGVWLKTCNLLPRAMSGGPRAGPGGSGHLVPQGRHEARFLQKLRQVRVLQEASGTCPAASASRSLFEASADGRRGPSPRRLVRLNAGMLTWHCRHLMTPDLVCRWRTENWFWRNRPLCDMNPQRPLKAQNWTWPPGQREQCRSAASDYFHCWLIWWLFSWFNHFVC